ncbi:MAG TPA: F0F1 ATP synthase subunit A [Gemmatimonadales bacterium]|nr:F0F1 ATP synthase subunit A [Gemmatimonadales bacterium]
MLQAHEAGQAAAQETVNIGEMVLHHTADAYSFGLEGLFHDKLVLHWEKWPDVHLGPLTLNFTPTKHVIFMVIAAILVFLTMWIAGRRLKEEKASGKAPKGFANAIEGLVLFIRDDVAIANIGHDGAKFAPFIATLFFFILYMSLLGLLPWGASATGNLAVTGGLAILSFLVIEISGMRKLGFKGYMKTIFMEVPGIGGAAGIVLAVGLAPVELMGKLVKPFALAVRLFGNMVAGHFVILSLFGIIFLFGALAPWNYAIGFTTAGLVTGIMLLELFVASLQAYVFALLTAIFIGLMQEEHH